MNLLRDLYNNNENLDIAKQELQKIQNTEIKKFNEHNSIVDLDTTNSNVIDASSNKDEFESKRKLILAKNPDEITREDLPYLELRDNIVSQLTNKYKDIIKTKDSIDFIYKQFGLEIMQFIKDPSIIEINLNQDGSIWIEKFAKGRFKTNVKMSSDRANSVLKVIADFDNKVIDRDKPILSSVLPTGERIEGIIGEPAKNNPIFAIRKKPSKIFTLDDYVKSNVITEHHKELIKKALIDKKNILIVGGTSSGKTTFANACLNELKNLQDRIVILEDTPELICEVDDLVELTTTQTVTMQHLLKSTMRLTPDRIVVGELRDGISTIELLKLWNSGHSGGLTTIHANNAVSGLLKLEQYLGEVSQVSQINAILEAVNYVVVLAKINNERKLTSISEVLGYDKNNQKYILNEVAI